MKPVPGVQFFLAVTPSVKWTLFGWGMLEFILILNYIINEPGGDFSRVLQAAMIVIPFVAVLFVVVGFMRFASRCRSISFPVDGWNEIYGSKESTGSETWWPMKVEIVLQSEDTPSVRGCNDILRRMITSANKRFYKDQMGSNSRPEWIITNSPLTAYGSCSRDILGDIIAMLATLQRSGRSIRKVKLSVTGKYFEVKAESDTMS